jgi:hypothetical protein
MIQFFKIHTSRYDFDFLKFYRFSKFNMKAN